MLPYISAPFEYLSSTLGASPDELKTIFSFLLSYPLAGLLKRIPDERPYQKNLFIISVSCFYLIGLFDLWAGVRTLLISSTGAYFIAKYIQGPFMPWVGFIFLMGHMSFNHIDRKYNTQEGAIDITGAQMVLVMKLTAFCWNVQDGRLQDNDLSDFQKEHAVRTLPGLLNYAAYVLFFPSLMAGPAFDYMDYERWIETTMFQVPAGTDPSKAPPTRKKRRIPRSGTPAAFKAATGFVWLLVFLKLGAYYDPNFLLSSAYGEYSFLRRVWIMYITAFSVRTKYYAVWSLSEGSCILSGIGYKGINPATGRPDWNRLQNVNPVGIELAQNSRAYLGNWNINTNNWLRNYMYLRVTPKGKKPGFRASMATFVTSAFWHGFEPGYYLTFILASFIQTVAKNCRRFLRPLFLTPTAPQSNTPAKLTSQQAPPSSKPTPQKMYYDIASFVATQLVFAFTVTPFFLLKLPACLTAWSQVFFYAIIVIASSMAFFASPGKGYLRKLQARRVASLGADKPSTTTPVGDHGPAQAADGITGFSLTFDEDGKPSIVREKENIDGSRVPHGPALGLPDDPGQDLDDMMDEIKREVEARRGRGQSIGQGLQEAVQRKIREVQDNGRETMAESKKRVVDERVDKTK